jgi:hypothetical protein
VKTRLNIIKDAIAKGQDVLSGTVSAIKVLLGVMINVSVLGAIIRKNLPKVREVEER